MSSTRAAADIAAATSTSSSKVDSSTPGAERSGLSVAPPAHLMSISKAIEALSEDGPALGRPLVDTIKGSRLANLKELRPGSAGTSEVRLLFVFDPDRQAVILVGGDKAGNWQNWYRSAVPIAESAYDEHLRRMRKKAGHDDQPLG